MLNRPQKTQIRPTDASVNTALAFFTQGQFLALIDNEQTWQTMQDFVVRTGTGDRPGNSRRRLFRVSAARTSGDGGEATLLGAGHRGGGQGGTTSTGRPGQAAFPA